MHQLAFINVGFLLLWCVRPLHGILLNGKHVFTILPNVAWFYCWPFWLLRDRRMFCFICLQSPRCVSGYFSRYCFKIHLHNLKNHCNQNLTQWTFTVFPRLYHVRLMSTIKTTCKRIRRWNRKWKWLNEWWMNYDDKTQPLKFITLICASASDTLHITVNDAIITEMLSLQHIHRRLKRKRVEINYPYPLMISIASCRVNEYRANHRKKVKWYSHGSKLLWISLKPTCVQNFPTDDSTKVSKARDYWFVFTIQTDLNL